MTCPEAVDDLLARQVLDLSDPTGLEAGHRIIEGWRGLLNLNHRQSLRFQLEVLPAVLTDDVDPTLLDRSLAALRQIQSQLRSASSLAEDERLVIGAAIAFAKIESLSQCLKEFYQERSLQR